MCWAMIVQEGKYHDFHFLSVFFFKKKEFATVYHCFLDALKFFPQ